jgi:hypothetical protein
MTSVPPVLVLAQVVQVAVVADVVVQDVSCQLVHTVALVVYQVRWSTS